MPKEQHTATHAVPSKKYPATPTSCVLSDGITAKERQWVARIMKASSAPCVPVMNAKENERKLDSMTDSLTSSAPNPDHVPAPVPYTAPENGSGTDKKFHLDGNAYLMKLWRDRQIRQTRKNEDDKAIKMIDAIIDRAMGDAEEIYVNNTHVATYVPDGSFKKKQFFAEQPELAEECTVYERAFSLERLKTVDPKVYAQYRARTMRLKNNPPAP